WFLCDELVHHLCRRIRPPTALACLWRLRGVGDCGPRRQHGDAGDRFELAAAPGSGGEAAGDRGELRGQLLALAFPRVPCPSSPGRNFGGVTDWSLKSPLPNCLTVSPPREVRQ